MRAYFAANAMIAAHMAILFALFETAIGRCAIAWGARGVAGVQLPEASNQDTRERVLQRFPGAVEAVAPPEIASAPDAISRLPAVLDQIDLIDLGPRIRILAQTARPATVRSLDAIHLGAALHSASELTSFVTYDKRLLEAARAAGLPVDSPALRQHRFAR